jgi:hypothetical protein
VAGALTAPVPVDERPVEQFLDRARRPSLLSRRGSPYDDWVPVPIFVDGEGVGFAEMRKTTPRTPPLHRGRRHRRAAPGQRLGKAGTQEPVACLRQRPGCELIAPSVHEEIPARAVYRLLGFVETGERDEGELVIVLPPNP